MALRRACESDIPVLCAIRKQQLIDEGFAPVANMDNELEAYFSEHLGDDALVEWVCEEEGTIVATAAIAFMPFPPTYANPVGTRGYITNMYTAPSCRGRGIASRLLGLLVDEARERGIHKLLLSASEMGKSVYRRAGFVESDKWMELDL